MNDKYRIKWQSAITGVTSHGTGLFTKEVAEQIAEDLNSQKDAICVHWAELVKDEGVKNATD